MLAIMHFIIFLFPSVALREEYGSRMFEKRVLRWIFRPKREEVTGVTA
jgi:hypothetical protein